MNELAVSWGLLLGLAFLAVGIEEVIYRLRLTFSARPYSWGSFRPFSWFAGHVRSLVKRSHSSRPVSLGKLRVTRSRNESLRKGE